VAEFLIGIVTLVVLTVVINKTTEDRLHAIKPHLREIWWALGFIYVTYWIWRPESEKYLMALKQGFGASYPTSSYILVGVLGFVLFVGYWWSLGIVLPAKASENAQQAEDKKPLTPAPPARKPDISQESKGDNSPNVIGNNNVVGDNNTINSSDPKILLRLEEIKKLLEDRQGLKASSDQLLKRYPLGYVIFDVENVKSVLPYRNEIAKTWHIDWSVVEIQDETKDGFWLRLPDMRNKNGVGSFLNSRVGVPKRVGPFPQTIMRQGSVDLKGEILAINEGRIVFLLGFVDNGTPAS
jgi:hypothetical protein